MTGPGLQSIAGFRLVTADLQRLMRFYVDVLGFAVQGPPAPIGAAEIALLKLSGRGRRQVLSLDARTVALDAFDTPGAPYPANGDAASLWFEHLALLVGDIAAADARLQGVRAITQGGPQRLPLSSGGVSAFKFRDPDGHPLELLQFPAAGKPPAWRGKQAVAGQIGLGIDHSAISVSDADASGQNLTEGTQQNPTEFGLSRTDADGFAVDPRGWVWTTAADGIHVVAPDRTRLGYIPTPAIASNCTFGGPGNRRLFIAATRLLLAIDLLA